MPRYLIVPNMSYFSAEQECQRRAVFPTLEAKKVCIIRKTYPELKSKCKLENDNSDPQIYCIADAGVTCSGWQAEGGLILEIAGNSVRVIWFDDQPKHLLRASGFNALGVPFNQNWEPRVLCS